MPAHTFELCFVFLISHSTFMPNLINFYAQQLIPGYVFKCIYVRNSTFKHVHYKSWRDYDKTGTNLE